MKHNYFKHLFTALLLLCSTVAMAHDFETDGIYYTITDAANKTVAVSYKGDAYNSYSKEYSGSVVIPKIVCNRADGVYYGVTSIGDGAFYACGGLTSITIPGSVTSIGNGVFDNCTSLKDLRIEDGNEVLTLGKNSKSGKGLFYDSPLNTLYLGRNLSYQADKSSGYSPFYGKSTLASVTIGNCVTSIEADAFKGCSGLTAVYISDLAAWCGIDFGNFDANPLSCAHNLYLNEELVTNLNIPDGVTSIKESLFEDCTSLVSVEIPGSVTNIGNRAFSDCSGLAKVIISDGVTSIGEGAFFNCTGLESVYVWSETPPTLGMYAFYDVPTTVTLYVPVVRRILIL